MSVIFCFFEEVLTAVADGATERKETAIENTCAREIIPSTACNPASITHKHNTHNTQANKQQQQAKPTISTPLTITVIITLLARLAKLINLGKCVTR